MSSGMHGHSAACCTIPPIQHDYSGKGSYIEADGIKTYATGSSSSKTGILLVYDIFGYYPQTIQGADILATSGSSASNQYQVFVPDFFGGKPADISWYPPDNKDKEEKLGQFFQTTGNPAEAVKKVPGLVKALSSSHGVDKWAIVGFCWGGKVATLSIADDGKRFGAAAVAHPAMVDPKDAPGVTIPFAMLPSKDEPMDDVRAFEKELKVPNLIKPFPDMIHGFMGARGDLKDDKVVKQYQEGYQTILEFFHKHL